MAPVGVVPAAPAEQLVALRRAVSAHLRSQGVAAQIKSFLDALLDGREQQGAPPPSREEALAAMANAGVLEHVLRSLGDPQDVLLAATAAAAASAAGAGAALDALAWGAAVPPCDDGSVIAAGPPPASATLPGAMQAGARYLLLRVPRGRAFADLLTPAKEGSAAAAAPALIPFAAGEQLALAGQAAGHRFAAPPVPCGPEPAFGATFLIDLTAPPAGLMPVAADEAGPALYPSSLMALARRREPLELLVTRLGPEGGPAELLGRAELDWRRVLAAPSGRVAVPLQVMTPGLEPPLPAGVLEITLELLPRPGGVGAPSGEAGPLGPGALREQQRLEASRETAAMSAFLTKGKRWWAEYVAARESHRGRSVKVFARDDNGLQRPVCAFVCPLRTRLIGSAREAARFVALLPCVEPGDSLPGGPTGGGAAFRAEESWRGWATVFACGSASREEKALLLCCLLLGLGLDAYVCVGRDEARPDLFVLTRDGRHRPTLWAPRTGCRYGWGEGASPLLDCPFSTIGSVFNARCVWGNTAASDTAVAMRYELEDAAFWRPLPCDEPAPLSGGAPGGARGPGVAALLRRPAPLLLPSIRCVPHLEEARLEAAVRPHLAAYRAAAGFRSTEWDEGLSHLLMPALAAYEADATGGGGAAAGNDEFQQSIKRCVPAGHTFRGVPLHFTSRASGRLAAGLLRDMAAREVLSISDPGARFALRVRVSLYPEEVVSVWAMLAVRYVAVTGR